MLRGNSQSKITRNLHISVNQQSQEIILFSKRKSTRIKEIMEKGYLKYITIIAQIDEVIKKLWEIIDSSKTYGKDEGNQFNYKML